MSDPKTISEAWDDVRVVVFRTLRINDLVNWIAYRLTVARLRRDERRGK